MKQTKEWIRKRIESRKNNGKPWISEKQRKQISKANKKRKGEWTYNRKNIKCKLCSKIFNVIKSKKRKFCSRRCYHKYRNKFMFNFFSKIMKKKWKNPKYKENQIQKHLGIKNPFLIKWNKEHSGKKSFTWKDGASFELYGLEFNKELRKYIRKKYNHICQLCNKTKKQNSNRKLTIHHIDYDKKNNDEKNLTLLCVSCNSKVNFNRKYWENYFNENV